MKLHGSRSIGLLIALAAAAATSMLVNCSAVEKDADEPLSEDAVTGVNNPLGLALRYDAEAGRVEATLGDDLKEGEKLFVRVRRGKITVTSQKDLKCGDLTEAEPVRGSGSHEATGKVVYRGPQVDRSIIDLLKLYDDPRWGDNTVPEETKDEVAKGPDPIVEACIVKGSTVRAKLQTNLAQAWDEATKDEKAVSVQAGRVRIMAGDGGIEEIVDGSVAAPTARLSETDRITSQTEYAAVCVQELGEIPFFPKLADGKYGTFDCRDLVASDGVNPPAKVPGVEGADIPVRVDGTQATSCDPETPLTPAQKEYNCIKKCDEGMYLEPGACQPGPMVVTAKNAEGTHWVLLCRKVSDDGNGQGMMKSKMFNDIAMVGHNPRTGRTCFFQNSINSGRDGSKVTHPADREKSTAIWSSNIQSYCTGECHAADPFVHSKWIDGAKRANGKPIIPMMGAHPDFPISYLDSPYNLVAADVTGFKIPKQLVSDEVGACANCHRLAGNTAGRFARWATGEGDQYFNKITDLGKKFEESHWMPLRLDGLTAENFATSRYGKAMEFINKCDSSSTAEGCQWADVPRGRFNNPAVTP